MALKHAKLDTLNERDGFARLSDETVAVVTICVFPTAVRPMAAPRLLAAPLTLT